MEKQENEGKQVLDPIRFLSTGVDELKNKDDIKKLLEAAIRQEEPEAQFILGKRAYERWKQEGHKEEDYQKALYWLEQAAVLEHTAAIDLLEELRQRVFSQVPKARNKGKGKQKAEGDLAPEQEYKDNTRDLLEAAIRQKESEAQLILGKRAYERWKQGGHREEDFQEALYWLKQASDQKNAAATALFDQLCPPKEKDVQKYQESLSTIFKEKLAKKDAKQSTTKTDIKNEFEEQDDLKKLQDDLGRLMGIKLLTTELINIIASTKIDQSIFTDKLKKIGQLICEISWKESNHNCIRNKHGYRNRHKDKSNNKNEEGAKLNFEALVYLKDLDEAQCAKLLINNNELGLVRTSLDVIQQKVDFILSKEYNHLTEEQRQKLSVDLEPNTAKASHDKDEGFLKKVSSYYHDVSCINDLIDFLKESEGILYSSLDLKNNKVDRYWLGYLFVLIGETAKEISEYIRIEKDQDARKNIIRFLFGKLGHHRQKIKGAPGIIYLTQEETLLDIKKNFEEARIELKRFLFIIKDLLLNYANKISSYETISSEIEKNKETIDTLGKKLNLNLLVKRKKHNLKQRIEGIENNIRELENAKKYFEERKQDLEGKKLSAAIDKALEKDTKQIKDSVESYLKLQPNDSNKTIDNIIKYFPEAQDRQKLLISQIKETREQLKKSSLSDTEIEKRLSDKVFELKKIKLQISLAKILTNKKLRDYLKKGRSETDFSQLSFSELLDVLSKEDNPALDKFDNTELEIKSLGDKISRKQKQIAKSKKELEDLEKELQTKLEGKQNRILKKIIYELQNLAEIESSGATLKLGFARKMSIGFIGQYCKELIENPDASNEIKKYLNHILKDCIDQTIHVRHKYIMHDSRRKDDGKIQETSLEHLIPSYKYFDCLRKVTDGNNKDLIELSAAFMMLGKYDIAIEIIQECYKKMESGEKLAKINYDEFKSTTPEQEYTLQLYKLAKTFLPKDFFNEAISHLESVTFKIKLLS